MRSLLLFICAVLSTNLYAQPWTQLVKDAYPGGSGTSPLELIAYNGTMFYSGWDQAHGNELWVSDGTAANTQMLKDTNPLGSGYPTSLCSVNGRVLFCSSNNTDFNLWATDGTAQGTIDLGVIVDPFTVKLMPAGQIAYFLTDNANIKDLWRTDGTVSGTQKIAEVLNNTSFITNGKLGSFTIANGKIYFVFEGLKLLFVSDGTASGTTKIVIPTRVQRMITFKGRMYFSGEDGKLYTSDGTLTGTVAFSNIAGGLLYTTSTSLYIINSKIWRSDGTPSGTVSIASAPSIHHILPPLLVGSTLYYATYVLGTMYPNRQYLNKLDLSTGKYSLLDTTVNISGHGNINNGFLAFQNKIYFDGSPIYTAMDGTKTYGRKSLYSHDMVNGKIKAIAEIVTTGSDFNAAIIGNQMFLSADDSVRGYELWRITDVPTGIEVEKHTDNNIVTIYPNPALDRLTLQLASKSTATYKIVDLYGRTLLQGTAQEKTELNITNLSAGVYQVIVSEANREPHIRPFVKQ